jgi:hypothetical protein
MRRLVFAVFLTLVFAIPALSQTPTPVQSTVNFSIGAGAFGLAPTSNSTPASDVTLQLNPGFKSTYLSQTALLSDNLLSSGMQYFGGGFTGPVPDPFPTTSVFGNMYIYWRASVGADRITIGSATNSHVSFLAGGGLGYIGPSGLRIQLIEIDDAHFPGAPFGNNAPAVSGSIAWIFGNNTASAKARMKAAKKQEHDWIHGPWPN